MEVKVFTSIFCIILIFFCVHKIMQKLTSIAVIKSLAKEYGKDTDTINRIFENNIIKYVSRIDGVDAEDINVEIERYRTSKYMELNGLTDYICGDAVVSYLLNGNIIKKDVGFRVEVETLNINDMNLIVRMFD